jgi:general secretion pathway protein A
MYLNFYGLDKQPFSISPDPAFIWFSSRHQEAFNALKYGIEEDKGFVVLTGDVGTGKTLLIKNLEKKIAIPTIIVTVPDPDMKPLEFFQFFADEVQMNRKFKSKGEFLIHFKNFLLEAFGSHKKVLLILDEAQRLNHKLLEEIRLLSNLEMTNKKLINIFFVGQNEFANMLNDDRSKAVRQRITVGYHLHPLTEDETASYIEHRLKVAGSTKQIFGRDAIHEIYNLSKGYPRVINILCDNALQHGSNRYLPVLSCDVIKEVAKKVLIPKATILNNGGKAKVAAVETPALVDIKKNEFEKSTDKVNIAQDSPQAHIEPSMAMEALESDETTEAREPSAIPRYAAVALFIALLGSGAYLFYNHRSDSDPRWSMEDIAPKNAFKITDAQPSALEQNESSKDAVEEEKPTSQDRRMAVKAEKPDKTTASAIKKAEQKPQNGDLISAQISEETVIRKDIDESPAEKLAAPAASPAFEPSAKAFPKDKIIMLFPFNSITLPDDHLATLDQFVQFALEQPDAEIIVEGYTDASGNFWYNQKLSQARANAIKNYFVEQGIDPSRIQAVGLGSEAPIDDNETPEGRSRNRRVEIKFSKKDILIP